MLHSLEVGSDITVLSIASSGILCIEKLVEWLNECTGMVCLRLRIMRYYALESLHLY